MLKPQIRHSRLARATVLVAFGILLSNLSGFLREAAIAAAFGLSRATDAYLIAFTLPEFVNVALSVVLGAVLVPLLTEVDLESGLAAAWGFWRRAGARIGMTLVITAAAGALLAPWYVPFLAPGFSLAARADAIRLSRIIWPATVVMGLSATVTAWLHLRRHFAWPALAPAAYNLAFATIALIAARRIGVDALAWGVLVGTFLHLGVQSPVLAGERESGRAGERRSRGAGEKRSRRVGRLAWPLFLGYTAHHVAIFVDRAMASALEPGSVAAIFLADHLVLVIGQLLGQALATTLFPELALLSAQGDRKRLRQALVMALRWMLLLGLPAAVGLIIVRRPLITLLFRRGAFDREAVDVTASLVAFYAGGMLADALCQPLWRATYALQRWQWVIGVNTLKTVLRVVGNLVLIPLLTYNGIALSATLGMSVQLVILLILLSVQVGRLVDKELIRFLARLLIATLGMAAIARGALMAVLASAPEGTVEDLLALALPTLTGGLVFILFAWRLKLIE
ncbi:MAG TPA: murein biosynthesis integral membrane protein MurJ [Anaerolineae bacterium]|nr:murein biosynthesis integral membrane protein MurJ [Anaerolineae bacterium]